MGCSPPGVAQLEYTVLVASTVAGFVRTPQKDLFSPEGFFSTRVRITRSAETYDRGDGGAAEFRPARHDAEGDKPIQ